LLTVAEVRRAVRLAGERGARLVILTGRWAPPALLREADLATELRNVRHPFEKGVKPVHGIDF
jgi:cob(I)alamin adenosyltransferase